MSNNKQLVYDEVEVDEFIKRKHLDNIPSEKILRLIEEGNFTEYQKEFAKKRIERPWHFP